MRWSSCSANLYTSGAADGVYSSYNVITNTNKKHKPQNSRTNKIKKCMPGPRNPGTSFTLHQALMAAFRTSEVDFRNLPPVTATLTSKWTRGQRLRPLKPSHVSFTPRGQRKQRDIPDRQPLDEVAVCLCSHWMKFFFQPR